MEKNMQFGFVVNINGNQKVITERMGEPFFSVDAAVEAAKALLTDWENKFSSYDGDYWGGKSFVGGSELGGKPLAMNFQKKLVIIPVFIFD